MATVLYVESSPRQQRSHSASVAHAFLDAWLRRHPGDTVDAWDLWSADSPLIEFDGDALTAKYAARLGNASFTDGERSAWAEVTTQCERLLRADTLVLSVPMWNFGVPYKFKHWVDVVTQPGLTFRPDPVNGPRGLLNARKALLVSARGGVYAPGTPFEAFDLTTPFVRRWLGMLGVSDLAVLPIEGTGVSEAAAQASRARGIEQAQAIAANF